MRPILERLKEGEILVSDGAMGTMLIEAGLPTESCPELHILNRPEAVIGITMAYREAGADILQTNTFGASPAKLSGFGLEDRTEEINRKGVYLAREVAAGKAYVSGSCGPSAKMLKPYGETEPEILYDSFERQFRAMEEVGVDLFLVETMTDLEEATLAVKAAKSVSPETPVAATMTFDETPRGFYTIMGVGVKEAAEGLEKAGADMIGSNCGNGIEKMIEIARALREVSTLPVVIQSNAGLPETRDGRLVYSETPRFFAKKAIQLMEAGVSVIGGCCGTTPEHIRLLRKLVDSRNS